MTREMETGASRPAETVPAACESEPIHIPGLIQAHGALVAFDAATGTVLHASSNLHRWLPVGDPPAEGLVLSELVGAEAFRAVGQALMVAAGGAVRHQVIDLPARPSRGQPGDLEAVVHTHGGVCIVEFEPAAPAFQQRDWVQVFGDTLDALRGAVDLDDLVERAAQRVKLLTHFDRVMVYRFEDDWSGHVIVDDREPGMESFLGLHYPASDIPAQARELYRGNLVRYVADTGSEPVPVLAGRRSQGRGPLDMSHAMLRSASPMHIQYLRNMDVASTLTISLLVDDRLWGLIACHHRVPKELPIRLRRACYALAIDVGSMVGLSLQRHSAAVAADVMQAQNRIVDIFNQAQVPLAEVIEQTGAALLRITGATGGALWRGKTVLAFGVWPEGARGESILKYLMHAFETSGEELLCTEKAPLQPALKSEELRSVCGVMAIRLEALAASGIAWIRPEFRREVAWGGDPDKPMQMDLDAEGRPKLSPRSSFARWETIVKGRCRPWSDQDRAAAATLLTLRQVLAVRDSLAQVSLSDRHLRSLVALQSDAYWQVDPRGTLVALSKPLPAWEGPVEGRTLLQLFEPSCEREDIDALDRALRSRKPFRALHLRGRHGTDGRAFEVLLNGEPIRDQGGRSAGWHGTITDVTDEATTQAALRQREVEQQAMLDNDLIGIVKLRDRHFVWKNRAMDRIFGYGPDELYGKSSRILYGDDNTFEAVAEAAQAVLQAGGFYRTQLQMLRKDGNPIWIDVNGALVSVEHQESMWLLVDITPIKESQQQVEHLAFHDGLTGLPNRHLLADRLNQAQALARRQGRSLAVCYVDLDGFKQVNDSYGHAAGDQLLREVARRLQRSVRVIDTVCRVGGDEFVLLLTQLEHGAECEAMLRRVVAEIERPVILDDGRVAQVSATVGAAIFPRDGQQADMLLRNADRAMYEGKQRGRNRVCMYQEERTDP